MENAGPVILIALLVAAGVAAIILGARHTAQRRDALAALAAKLGWSFDPGLDRDHDERYAQFPIFRRGHSRAAFNTLAGPIEIAGRVYQGRMGDFRYKVTRSNGKSTSTRTYTFTYVILHPPFALPHELRIRPEGMLDKLAGALGFDDIDFESSEFSRRFHVKCADKRFAYDVITPRMMEFLLGSSPFVVEVDRGCCCLSNGQARWSPAEFEPNLSWLGRFFEQWPEFLLEQLGGGVGRVS